MKLLDYLLNKCQHDLSLCKAETANIKHIDLLGKAMEIIRQIVKEREGK